MSALVITSILTLGNFIYQALQKNPSWDVAIERSYFQAVAIAFYLIFRNH